MHLTSEERRQVIVDLVSNNIFDFIAYMDFQQEPPTDDFLSTIMSLYSDFEEELAVKLLIRVFKMFKGEVLILTHEMAMKGMNFLASEHECSQAAFGFLRLCFQNDINFSTFPLDLLIKFQEIYRQMFISFFKSCH
jgi:hypothetical protein